MNGGLSRRDALFNAILKSVKENASGCDVGLVRAVLGEVETEIAMKNGRTDFDVISGRLKERMPRG